jgi:hypothetical protein
VSVGDRVVGTARARASRRWIKKRVVVLLVCFASTLGRVCEIHFEPLKLRFRDTGLRVGLKIPQKKCGRSAVCGCVGVWVRVWAGVVVCVWGGGGAR